MSSRSHDGQFLGISYGHSNTVLEELVPEELLLETEIGGLLPRLRLRLRLRGSTNGSCGVCSWPPALGSAAGPPAFGATPAAFGAMMGRVGEGPG